MGEHKLNPTASQAAAGEIAPKPPATPQKFSVLVQFAKEISIDNPNAPRTLNVNTNTPRPDIKVNVNVNARALGTEQYEVNLVATGSAGEGDNVMFKFDITYSGVFAVMGFPPDQIQPMVMIKGPELLFPYLRQLISELTRSCGFPPLYIDPMDFAGIYKQMPISKSNSGPQAYPQ